LNSHFEFQFATIQAAILAHFRYICFSLPFSSSLSLLFLFLIQDSRITSKTQQQSGSTFCIVNNAKNQAHQKSSSGSSPFFQARKQSSTTLSCSRIYCQISKSGAQTISRATTKIQRAHTIAHACNQAILYSQCGIRIVFGRKSSCSTNSHDVLHGTNLGSLCKFPQNEGKLLFMVSVPRLCGFFSDSILHREIATFEPTILLAFVLIPSRLRPRG
jgi:hypothetical protein